MALLSKTLIYIGGKEVPSFKSLKLNQMIGNHHDLEIVFSMEMFEKESSELGEKSKNFLGEKISIQVESYSDNPNMGKLMFKGIITEVNLIRGNNFETEDEIVLVANSPTIKADNGAHNNSFNETLLDDIVKNSLDPFDLKSSIVSRYTDPIEYCVQSNESTFDFVCRLGQQYGEWCYYNGESIVFGKPEISVTALRYNLDLMDFKLSLVPLANKANYFSPNYLQDAIEENDSPSQPSGSSFDGFVYNVSENLFNVQTTVSNNNNNSTNAARQLKAKVQLQQEGTAINQVRLSGSSNNPGVKIGNLVKVDGELYRITEVVHKTLRTGEYHNEFQAISGSYDASPFTNINAFPKSASQVGIVKENNDPQGLGRVRVQFPWQKKQNKMTCWMRVVSLQAGSGGGMYRIPHVNDEVIVNFENGNAEMPYTAGSVYNSNSKPPEGSSDTNNYYTIWQVGLCIIKINEIDGSITFIDKSKSYIKLEGNGDITINAELNLNILALNGEVNIDARTINLGSESSDPDLTNIHGKKIHIHASQLLELLSDIDLKASGTKTEVAGTATTDIKGATVSVVGTGLTEIKGGIVKMN